MGQRQIVHYLEQNIGRWFTSTELQNQLGLSANSANTSLRTILNYKYSSLNRRKKEYGTTATHRRALYEYTIRTVEL